MILTACPLCDGVRIEPYVVVKNHAYFRCQSCGFAFLNPMPAQVELNAEYQGQKGISIDYYPHAASRKRKALLRALRLLPYLLRRRVLDIGCGGGFFVNAARLLGARVTGLDVDANTIAYAKRSFPHGDFQCVSFDTYMPDRQYDLIHCSELVEHVPDPHVLMRLLSLACKPGGYVYVTTPDLDSPNVPENVAQWPGFAPPAHVGLFGDSNLRRLFSDYGFDAVKTYPRRKTGVKILFRKQTTV